MRHASEMKERYDRYRFLPAELLQTLLCGAGIGLLVQWLCYHDWRAFPVAILVAWIVLRRRRDALLCRKKETLEKHFGEALQAIYTSLCAGYSLENCIAQAAGDMEQLHGRDDVLTGELRGIQKGLALRVPVEKLFYDLGERSGTEDLQHFGEILMIAKRTGGNLDAAVRSCYRTISERLDTRGEIRAITAAKRFEHRVMSLMPAGIILYARISFGGFMDGLYGNVPGVLIMTAALAVYGIALLIGERMVRIEV